MNKFSESLIEIMEEKGIDAKFLASKLDVGQNTISRWRNGVREPSFDILLEICIILDTEPSEILGWNAGVKYDLIKKLEDKKENK